MSKILTKLLNYVLIKINKEIDTLEHWNEFTKVYFESPTRKINLLQEYKPKNISNKAKKRRYYKFIFLLRTYVVKSILFLDSDSDLEITTQKFKNRLNKEIRVGIKYKQSIADKIIRKSNG